MVTAPIPSAALAPTPSELERALVAQYRAENPRSRAPRVFVYDQNTSARASMRNILTGETGPTWCARWPKTKTAIAWEAEQRVAMFGEEASCS